MDLREELRTAPMRGLQFGVAAVCIVLAIVDGYEILVMGLVAPTLARDWDLDNVTIGYLLSAGLVGMALGAVLLGPLADRIGRRRHILLCLALSTVGMGLSAMAQDVPMLMALRVFAGLWLGAVVPSLNTMVSEYASDKRRGAVMGVYGIGLPGGMVLGGAITGWLVSQWGWQGPFMFSALASVVMFVVAWFVLPESVEYLIERRPANAVHDYNRIAARFGHHPVTQLPSRRARVHTDGALRTVFTGTLLRRTVLLWSGYALTVAALYFANSWTPKMIADATGNDGDGRTVTILISVGGIVGSLLFALCTTRWNPRLITAALGIAALPLYLLFAFVFETGAAKIAAVFVGIVTIGAMAAFYAISPYVYPTRSRSSAVGFMIGSGRAVSILVPIGAGYFLDTGGTPQQAFQLAGVAMLVMGLFAYGLHRTYCGRTEDPELVQDEDRVRHSTALPAHEVPRTT